MTGGYRLPAMALAVVALCVAPAQAQQRSCDDGRGVLLTDLGYHRLHRSNPGSQGGDTGSIFDAEPRIGGVRADGPGAGQLREGDVLLAVDGQPITTPAGGQRYTRIQPGERVRLSVRRGGRVEEVTLVAGARCVHLPPAPPEPPHAPPAPDAPPAPNPPTDELMPDAWLGFGIRCQNCGDDPKSGVFRFFEPPVVARVEPNSAAARAGLRSGDQLTHLDGVPFTSEAGWPRFLAIQPGQEVRFTYVRGGETGHATIGALRRPGV